MKRLESYTENRVVAWAKRRGVRQAKLTMQGQNAYPDRIFFVPGGKPVLIEFKREGASPSKLQRHTINQLIGLEYDVVWTYSAEEAIAYLEKRISS